MLRPEFCAGTAAKGDCLVRYRFGPSPLAVEVASSNGSLFLRSILETARRVAAEFTPRPSEAGPGPADEGREYVGSEGLRGTLAVRDEGALDYVIAARVEAALSAAGYERIKPLSAQATRHLGTGTPDRARPRRSRLYLPGNQPDLHTNAGLFGADCILLDLEDSVESGRKAEARMLVARLLSERRDLLGGSEIAVRVNPLGSPWGEADLEAVVPEAPQALVLPKCESADQIREWDDAVRKLERSAGLVPGSILFQPIIETARGLNAAASIAAASSRVVALGFGAEDFRAELGLTRGAAEEELAVPRCLLVIAARAAGVEALDSVYSKVDDETGLLESAQRARALGFSGKSLIHPSHIAIVNRVFSPTEEEVAWAREVIDALAAAANEGRGASTLRGLMIDEPLRARARSILAAAGAQHV